MRDIFARFWEWLKSWFTGRVRADLYRPKDRLIYSYWDGSKIVRADPMVLYQKLMERGPELSIDIKVAASPSKGAAKAHTGTIDKIRTAFALKPFDGTHGLTELEVLALLDHFLEFTEGIKKNSSPISTSPEAISDTTPTTSAAAPPTSNSSGSGSTASGEPTGPPTPTITVPESPSAPSNPA